MSEQVWDSNTISLLVSITRELKFDWNAVAKKLSAEITHLTINPTICRQQYTKEYSKNAKDETSVVTNTVTVDPSKVEIWESFDKMSLDELIQHVNKKEQEMNTQREAIFQRVLNSLGSSEDIDSQLSDAMAAEIDEVRKKYFESVQQKEIDKLNKQQLAFEHQEKMNIEQERQKLKKRFDADSVDNIGDYPLGDLDVADQVKVTNVGSALSANDSAALAQLLSNSQISGSTADKQLFASLVKNGNAEPEAVLSTDLESILMGEQFDILLSEIEKELDAESQDKVEGTFDFEYFCD